MRKKTETMHAKWVIHFPRLINNQNISGNNAWQTTVHPHLQCRAAMAHYLIYPIELSCRHLPAYGLNIIVKGGSLFVQCKLIEGFNCSFGSNLKSINMPARRHFTHHKKHTVDHERVIIVSNRLPIKVKLRGNNFVLQSSEGGLATGLDSIYKQNDNIWIGWPGTSIHDDTVRAELNTTLQKQNLFPVYLSEKEIREFYEGFSNETLWPLYHYFISYAHYRYQHWDTYQKVNLRFAEAVVQIARPGDIIWIHDYQLSLVPGMVRERLPGATIGFFQHIPFPGFEIFRLLPWRREILQGLIGADLIGFHTLDDTRHFMNACARLLDTELIGNQIVNENRQVKVDAFPMGIDFEKYQRLAQSDRTRTNENRLRQMTGDQKLMIAVDRLDYTKGILNRLEAFEYLIKHHKEYREKISMLQLLVPSRDHVPRYKALKDEIDKKIGNINAHFGTFSWTPVHYFYRSFSINMLSALYATADIAIVSPMRDGMNLVSKEFVASKVNRKGVLILSEMAGAASELLHALIVNPNDLMDMVNTLMKAYNMPETEQHARMSLMRQVVSKFTIGHWVTIFIKSLRDVKEEQQRLATKIFNKTAMEMILQRYVKAKKKLILLDYDGTLVPFYSDILQASPDKELKVILKQLLRDPDNRVIVISGRDHDTLENWLGDLPLELVAEHGAWIKRNNGEWKALLDLPDDWKPPIRRVMEMYADRTPGSSIEEKDFSLVWHYRNVNTTLGQQRSKELSNNLKLFSADRPIQVLAGNKIVEVKTSEINKGKAARIFLKEEKYDFILAIGDDTTDEDIFREMPARAFTIKVGGSMSSADYFVQSYQSVRILLQKLAEGSQVERSS